MAKVLKNLLSDYGYNLVALPRQDIAPLMLLYKNGDAVSAAESTLQKLFKTADAPPPELIKDKIVTSINGNATVIFDSDAGFSMLDKLLQALKMGKLSAKTSLEALHKITITYENVLEDKVDLLDLDNFISGADPIKEGFNTFRTKLEKCELFVINNILKSNSFSISAEDATGAKLDIEATVKGVVDANVDISKNKNNAITLKHSNTATYIVFAFKAQKIIYDHKKWWQFFKKEDAKFHIKDEQGIILKGEEDFPTVPLQQGDDTVEI